jgi:dihydropteroate synthase
MQVTTDSPRPPAAALPRPARCVVIGVVNVTPDSFSDGGAFSGTDAAVAQGVRLLQEGADIVDVGGESTRPGAARVPAEIEMRRILPVIRGLAATGAMVSVDTMRARTAEAAVEAGASMINDVSGGLSDPHMPDFIASARVPYVLMHWRGYSHDMQRHASYTDVAGEVATELGHRMEAVVDRGVDSSQIILDPGLGFAKTAEHDWSLLARLSRLRELGHPILIGASRKSFLGALLAGPDGTPRSAGQREHATAAVSALAAAAGAWGVRVHDVRGSLDAVKVAAAWASAA